MSFGDLFTYDTVIQGGYYLMCTMTESDEYFEMIRFDEATSTLSFYRDHLQIKNKTPEMIIKMCVLI